MVAPALRPLFRSLLVTSVAVALGDLAMLARAMEPGAWKSVVLYLLLLAPMLAGALAGQGSWRAWIVAGALPVGVWILSIAAIVLGIFLEEGGLELGLPGKALGRVVEWCFAGSFYALLVGAGALVGCVVRLAGVIARAGPGAFGKALAALRSLGEIERETEGIEERRSLLAAPSGSEP